MTVTSSSLVLRTNATTLDTETVATDTGVWYEYYAKADGANVEVWRREKGTTDAMVKVLETISTTVTLAGYFTFASGTGNYIDDIVVLKLDGDTVKTEVQAYNAANEMTSQVADGATTNFAYDQYGRMTAKTRGGYTGTFTYNYGDKLTKVASNFQGEGTVTYAYSGDQKRRSRAVTGGTTTKYRFDHGWNVLNEEDGTGALQLTYIAGMATSAGTTASSGTYSYYSKDVIGSTRGLWDEDGDRLGKYDYTPFGGNYSSAGQTITRKYTGHDWDSTARLYHTAYRNYSPDFGRWLTRDPLGMVDGPNVYAYVTNNPIGSSDPLGLSEFSIGGVMSSVGTSLNLALAAMDIWGAYGTLTDPCASRIDKASAVGLAIFGIFGGGLISGGIKAVEYANVASKLIKIYGKSNSVINELGAFKHAAKFGVQRHGDLKLIAAGAAPTVQSHHLIPRRFSHIMGQSVDDMAAIALLSGAGSEHQKFTNAWATAFKNGDPDPTYKQIMDKAREIYAEYPELLRVIGAQ